MSATSPRSRAARRRVIVKSMNRSRWPMTNGKICYLEIPASDIEASAAFYEKVFDWRSRARGDGSRAFDDTTGAVSGTWVLGRRPARDPGILACVMVADIDATLRGVMAAGGEVGNPRT